MSLPLDLLNDNTSNTYELTNAMIHRAYQLTMSGETDGESKSEDNKPVIAGMRQILNQTVQYQIDSQ